MDIDKVIGATITALTLEDDRLFFTFSDGATLKLWDSAQNCCEHRYMHTEDNLADYIGATLLGVEIKPVDPIDDEWDGAQADGDTHDVQFLEIETSKGALTMVTHNEHNGYYGGFSVEAEVKWDEEIR